MASTHDLCRLWREMPKCDTPRIECVAFWKTGKLRCDACCLFDFVRQRADFAIALGEFYQHIINVLAPFRRADQTAIPNVFPVLFKVSAQVGFATPNHNCWARAIGFVDRGTKFVPVKG